MGYFPHNPRLSTRRAHDARMHAYVYKSQRKADTFVYLAARDDFGRDLFHCFHPSPHCEMAHRLAMFG